MARAKMICPFSGKLCKECPIYRGRHYLLCYKPKYRGYLKEPQGTSTKNEAVYFSKDKVPFKLKALDNTRYIDPYATEMPDIS